MYLLIDAGNSRIKWLYGNAVPGIVEAASYKEDWRTKLWRAWHLLPEPRRIAISCVNNASIETEVAAIVDDLWGKPLQTFIAQKETNHTLTVAYDEAHTLGADRYLAMLGARGLTHEPLCVVGCGTAITLDVVERDGQHRGGYHRFAFGGDAQILFGNRPDYRIEPDLMFRGMIDRLATD